LYASRCLKSSGFLFMEKEDNNISALKFVHHLQIQDLLSVQKSLRREALQWEIESVYMMHLLQEALALAKHTNHDSLTGKISAYLEYRKFDNEEDNTETENKEQDF
jgi:hypothetical protein